MAMTSVDSLGGAGGAVAPAPLGRAPLPARAVLATDLFRSTRLIALVPILSILMLQTVVALSLQNTAFQDEALYLYAGRQYFDQLLGGPPVVEPYASYFSGLPYLYPVIGGALDQLGGIALARLFSLACMLGATLAVFAIGKHVYGRESALLGAAVFAVQGPVLFLSHFATYDAMALFLIALATVLALRASDAALPWAAAPVGLVLAIAVGAKYAAALWVPCVLAVLAWQTVQTRGWRQAVVRTALASLTAGGLLALALALLNRNVLTGLMFTTLNRQPILLSNRLTLAEQAASFIVALLLLALSGLFLTERKHRVLAVILVGAVLLAPAYHVFKAESVSLNKHVAFGFVFAAPVAGYTLAWLSGASRRGWVMVTNRWPAGVAALLLLFSLGLHQAQQFFTEWPNSTALVQVLRTQVRPGSGRILAEELEVPRYSLQNIVAFWQWNNLYWFYYTDKAGQHLSGIPAYRAAIREGYFDLVIFRYGANAATENAIDSGLRSPNGQYTLLDKIPANTMFGSSDYWIWRRKAPSSAPGEGPPR